MLRLTGLLLIWSGCIFWGVIEGRRLRRRVHILEDMGWVLEVLERELMLNRTALPELLERLAKQKNSCAAMFDRCALGMKAGIGFGQAWTAVLEESELKEEERVLLSGLSQVLGRYDAQGQGQALRCLRREVEQRCARQREQACAMGRVYGVLGITAGGFLALMLL